MYNGASLPSRERGLKYYKADCHRIFICVAPLAGAWIEIKTVLCSPEISKSRSPRGSVD